MQSSKTKAALVAALFGIAATGSILTSSAHRSGMTPTLANGAPIAALADDHGDHHGDQGDDEDNQGEHHDNGKHKGWYKHHKHHGDDDDRNGSNGSRSIYGTIQNINGNLVNLRLNNGQFVTINDQNALNAGQSVSLNNGEYVRIYGSYGNDGTFYANRIVAASQNNQYGSNGYPNGNNTYGGNNCNTNAYNNGTTSVTGYETSGVNGNSFQLVTQQGGIPLPGQTYTIVTNNQTCVQTQLGNFGKRLTIVGYPSGDGRTIKAVRISG